MTVTLANAVALGMSTTFAVACVLICVAPALLNLLPIDSRERASTIAGMSDQPDLNDIVAVLERVPATVAALLMGLPDKWINTTEGGNTWSPYDVVGHLIHGERTDWMNRARHILSGKTEPFESFDRTAQFRESEGTNLPELLTTFAELRRENVAALSALELTDSDLKRTGNHPELGEVTLGQLLATWVVHDLDHIGQIARTMAKSYAGEVGPWQAYLSILKDRQP